MKPKSRSWPTFRPDVVRGPAFTMELELTGVHESFEDSARLLGAETAQLGGFGARDDAEALDIAEHHLILLYRIGVLQPNIGARLGGPVERGREVVTAIASHPSGLDKTHLDLSLIHI